METTPVQNKAALYSYVHTSHLSCVLKNMYARIQFNRSCTASSRTLSESGLVYLFVFMFDATALICVKAPAVLPTSAIAPAEQMSTLCSENDNTCLTLL